MWERPLCRLYVPGSFGKFLGTDHVLMASGAPVCWAATDDRQEGQVGMVTACCSCFLPLFRVNRFQQCSWGSIVLILQVGQIPQERSSLPAHTEEVEGNVDRVLKDSSNPIAFLQLLESSCSFPTFSIWFPFLVGCLNAVHSALSCLIGVTIVYTCIPLSFLMGKVNSRSLAQRPSWASPWCFY